MTEDTKDNRISWMATARKNEDEFPFVLAEASHKKRLEKILNDQLEKQPELKAYKILAHRVIKTHGVAFPPQAKINL